MPDESLPMDAALSLPALRAAVRSILDRVTQDSQDLVRRWDLALHDPAFRTSAANLAAYLVLRQQDLVALQPSLSAHGLSTLGRCEAHVLASLESLYATLARLCGDLDTEYPPPANFQEGHAALEAQIERVFGHVAGTGIMVTLPAEAATDPACIEHFLEAGMSCARINCAHDSKVEWTAMARNLRAGAQRLGRTCPLVMDLPGPKCRIVTLSPERPERLHVGDRFRLVAAMPGTPTNVPALTLSLAQSLNDLAKGQEVWIDDGKIRGRVVDTRAEETIVEVYGAKAKGVRLKPDKGVNFPGLDLRLPLLSEADLEDLDVVAAEADIVGFSFVQRPEDIAELNRELAARRGPGRYLPLMLKIETPLAVRNLPRLLVQAAGSQPVAVMIARGDLAVELGYARMAEMQEEILWLCEAARLPVVWATQVLDELIRNGLPSRAETTDAAVAQRAECVMLNKGPHLVEAIAFLKDVTRRMGRHQQKKFVPFGRLAVGRSPDYRLVRTHPALIPLRLAEGGPATARIARPVRSVGLGPGASRAVASPLPGPVRCSADRRYRATRRKSRRRQSLTPERQHLCRS